MFHKVFTAASMALAFSLTAGALRAETYPERAITWIVPFTPGGITDTSSRVVGDELSKALGQPVVIENRPGAGSMIGTEMGARAKPDGYTLVYGTQGSISSAPYLYTGLKFDPHTDLIPVHGIATSHNIIVTHPKAPFKTIPELVEYAKANPGKVNFGSAGNSTASHLLMELFLQAAEIDGLHVPYNGSAPAITDLLAGRVDVVFDYAISSLDHVTSGKLVALATNGPERHPIFPETPTMTEVGFAGATAGTYSMLFVPKGTPQDRVDTLISAMKTAVASAAVTGYLNNNGSRLLDVSGAEAVEFIKEQNVVWGRLIKDSGIQPQ